VPLAIRDEVGGPFVAGALALCAAALGVLAGVDPKLALAAAVGVAFALLAFTNLMAALAVFALSVFVEPVLLGGSLVSFTKFLGLLLLLSWIASASTGAHRASLATAKPLLYVLVGFLAWTALSLAWAASPAAGFTALYRYALNGVLLLLVAAAVRTRRDAVAVGCAFVGGATIAALYGLFGPGDVTSDLSRAEVGGLDPNQLAALLIPATMFAGYFALARGLVPRLRLAAAICALVCFGGIVSTFSRGGLIALVVALVVALLTGGRLRPRVFLVGAIGVVGVTLYFLSFAPSTARERITETTQGNATLVEGRATIWTVGWRMFESNAYHGVGAGNFASDSIHYLLAPGTTPRSDLIVDTPKVAHNTYLEILAELGILGGALFGAILVLSLAAAIRAARVFRALRDYQLELLARALAPALAGTLAADFFISDEFSKALWLLLGLGPALLSIAVAERRRATERTTAATDSIVGPASSHRSPSG
jgi:O-antigen ligase